MVGELGPGGGPGRCWGGEGQLHAHRLGHKASGSANSWDKGGLRRVLEQVSERTTFLFLNRHISYTARMEQVGKRSRGASLESGVGNRGGRWGELLVKEGVVVERTPHQGRLYRCLPHGTRKESAPLKGSKDGQDAVNWTPIQTVGGELRPPHEALPFLRVCVYDARSEHSVARATKNTNRKIKAELA